MEVESPRHLDAAEKAAEKSFVLLKNNGILPLDKEKLKTIGIIGPNADSRQALIGNYHGTASRYITIQEGIQDYVGDDVRILTSRGCDLFRDRTEHLAFTRDRIAEAKVVAENSDVVILCMGLDETLEGEEGDTGNSYVSGDKEDIELPGVQRELMEAIADTGKPVVFCLLAGSDLNLKYAAEKFDAVMMLWYPGCQGGKAAAKVLFGEISPSGKLPVTFYESLEELPDFTDYSMKGRTYRYYLENTIPATCATEHKGNAVLFINLDLCTLTIHEISDKIEGFIKSSMLSAGYSRKMLGHFNFHRQYTQASVTLQVGKRKNPAESIHYFDSIALPYILEQATKKLPAYMVCHEKLLSMKYKDEAKQSHLYETLRCFLEHNQNISHTASALFIHRSTLLYRLDKIKAFLDSDLTDRNEILYLLLSFHLMDMEEENRNARS